MEFGKAYAEVVEQMNSLKCENFNLTSHLPWMKYFVLITLKMVNEVKILIIAIQNCLSKVCWV